MKKLCSIFAALIAVLMLSACSATPSTVGATPAAPPAATEYTPPPQMVTINPRDYLVSHYTAIPRECNEIGYDEKRGEPIYEDQLDNKSGLLCVLPEFYATRPKSAVPWETMKADIEKGCGSEHTVLSRSTTLYHRVDEVLVECSAGTFSIAYGYSHIGGWQRSLQGMEYNIPFSEEITMSEYNYHYRDKQPPSGNTRLGIVKFAYVGILPLDKMSEWG